jgi:NAD+ synthase (glutamine-hydrolysing)
MKLTLAQINTTVGDLAGNVAKIRSAIASAKAAGADAVVFPELTITGYPPEDLLLKASFLQDNMEALKELSVEVSGITAIVGFADVSGRDVYNAAAVLQDGTIKEIYHKVLLPNYGVFDEKRYFKSSDSQDGIVTIAGVPCGITICEDIWEDDGPAQIHAENGAKVIITLNASPYHAGKLAERERVIRDQARSNKVHVAYVNLVGGQDELVFDGSSMVIDPNGTVIARAGAFKEEMLTVDMGTSASAGSVAEPLEAVEEVYKALKLGLCDYFSKNGFKKAVLGMSGGVDSALVATIAADALGRENLTGVFMPSEFSSKESLEDAEANAMNLGINFLNIPIQNIFKDYLKTLEAHFADTKTGVAEENLQARVRGNLLMALSNKFGWIVLTTGNKSEMSTGYATLYGDMAGGFALIKDVPKMLVYELCRWRNKQGSVIPRRVLTKAPTAELRANQKDSDSLPEYPVLDPILKLYVEEDACASEILAHGFKTEDVQRVTRLVDSSEYKRRQAPPGVKITPKAFGRDRRMPITNRYNK